MRLSSSSYTDNLCKALSTNHEGYGIFTNFKRKMNSEAVGSNIYMHLKDRIQSSTSS